MALISRIMFFVGAILDLLVSISIPVLYPMTNLAIVGITFTTNIKNGDISFVNTSSGFIGTLNNVSVNDLLDIQLGLWSACYAQGDPRASNGISNDCFTSALAYEVFLENASTNITTTILQTENTEPNFLVALAGAFSLIGASLGRRPHYLDYIFKVGATLLTMGAVIGQYLLFNFVKHEVPNLGSVVQSAPGTGLYITLVSFVIVFLGLGVNIVEDRS